MGSHHKPNFLGDLVNLPSPPKGLFPKALRGRASVHTLEELDALYERANVSEHAMDLHTAFDGITQIWEDLGLWWGSSIILDDVWCNSEYIAITAAANQIREEFKKLNLNPADDVTFNRIATAITSLALETRAMVVLVVLADPVFRAWGDLLSLLALVAAVVVVSPQGVCRQIPPGRRRRRRRRTTRQVVCRHTRKGDGHVSAPPGVAAA